MIMFCSFVLLRIFDKFKFVIRYNICYELLYFKLIIQNVKFYFKFEGYIPAPLRHVRLEVSA